MHPRVIQVKAEDEFKLRLTFKKGPDRLFDMKPYLSIGVFRELSDLVKFKAVRVHLGSIQWPTGQDLCPDTLFEESHPIAKRKRRFKKAA
ncbi:MAG: DUF2442 domain-containing protein [Elusimicrobia bacterium]|nr:DUF2442 domain-containing protein [Elusimicrobiota bacterium]